jgi:hypothetical protein
MDAEIKHLPKPKIPIKVKQLDEYLNDKFKDEYFK